MEQAEQFRAELTAVAADIQALLLADPLPREVGPEFLRRAVLAYPERGGKMLRPALLLWACGAVGGEPRLARQVAAAVELFHTWTLVHDDIIDQDDLRRGQPSAHHGVYLETRAARPALAEATARGFGVNMAILAGDIQQAWSNRLLLRAAADGVPLPVVVALLERLNGEINPGLISGEANDVEFELRDFTAVTPDELALMLQQKTALLLRFAAESGAQIGLGLTDRRHPWVTALGDFAERAGLAFQLWDDLLGLYGTAAVLGKPIGSDLRRGKRTLLHAVALERLQGEERAWFMQCLGQPELPDSAVRRAADLVQACGARAWVEARAADLVAEAQARLAALPPTPWRELLAAWGAYVCRRQH
jgi:geranylgeranyl diphosphate synthase type I